MQLESERLLLREMQDDDFEALFEIFSDEQTMKYYPNPFNQAKVLEWIQWNKDNYAAFGFGLFGVILKENGKLIGDCGITMQRINGRIKPEIGYHIHKAYQNKGYASEAGALCRDYIFKSTPFNRIFSYMHAENIPSCRVAEKCGMHLWEEYIDDDGIKNKVYSLSRAEWKSALNGKKIKIQSEMPEKESPKFLIATHCVFPVFDLDKTASFYHEKLGFRRVDYTNSTQPHICLYRDDIEFILTQATTGERVIPNRELYGGGEDVYIITDRQYELCREFSAAGVIITEDVHLTDYNNLEFTITDCDGRNLIFGKKQN